MVWFDGVICLIRKTIETKFCWPAIADETVELSCARLLTLLEGMNWRLVRRLPLQRPHDVAWSLLPDPVKVPRAPPPFPV